MASCNSVMTVYERPNGESYIVKDELIQHQPGYQVEISDSGFRGWFKVAGAKLRFTRVDPDGGLVATMFYDLKPIKSDELADNEE